MIKGELSNKMKTLLAVDDDAESLESVVKVGKMNGYNVTAVGSGREAAKLNQEFDLAIIDGLGGLCFLTYNSIEAKRKVIVSRSMALISECWGREIEAYHRSSEADLLKIFYNFLENKNKQG